jgi:hypothetical protein
VSPADVLGPTLAAAIRDLIRAELEERAVARAPAAPPLRRPVTVPAAARETGVSEETIRELIHAGRLPRRLAGANPNPKRPTFLVFADEVLAALERPGSSAANPAPLDFEASAARLRARKTRGG